MNADIRTMTEHDFATLLASVDDSADHHILWVTTSGLVRLSACGTLTPAGWEAHHAPELKFRWETFVAGNGYCGAKAAADRGYVRKQLAELKKTGIKTNGYGAY